MHPIMLTVLLGTRRRNPLMDDAELHPPDIQRRQAMDAGGGKWRPVVRADRAWQADLAEQRAERGLRKRCLHRAQAATDQQGATEMISHRQRIAICPSPVLNCPLKSAGHTWFGRSVCSAVAPGCVHFRRRRFFRKDYARPALDKYRLGKLIDVIGTIGLGDKENRARDILGRVYEYSLRQFASAEGKNGGQFYTPSCVVRVLVEMLAPYTGRIYDPCCGSGEMFVQSEKFVEAHGGEVGDISIY